MESRDDALKEICLNPYSNPLGLNKGVSFLVKCHNDFIIREWHSVDGKETKIYNRGIWNRETGFNETSEEQILNDYDILSGKILQSIKSVDDHIQEEYFDNLIKYIENAGNCTIKRFKWKKYYGVYNHNISTWNNARKLFSNGSLDIGMGFFHYLPKNFKDFDFCEPLAKLEYVFLIKHPKLDIHVPWYAYFKPFTFQSWIAFLFIIIISLLIQIFTNTKFKTDFNNKNSIGDEIFSICGIFLHQSIPSDYPKPGAAKIVHFSSSMFIFIIISLYTGIFVSKLTNFNLDIPFKSVEEYANVKSHKLIVFKHTASYNTVKNSRTHAWKEISKLLMDNSQQPKNAKEAMNMVKYCHRIVINVKLKNVALIERKKTIFL
ncbi:uncharacterized protein LOC127289416 [Leptopilina boulardi]|uniref:uncharacterized protein LOC127289416 n=1 Tax=Leptopilina boulardi TaxID=63433 RepID=UPI0021F5D583|nr:uncharacterized protein LOC127289416 [Leptopilina boulardi]